MFESAERTGEIFAGKYRIEAKLGEGGMGSVYGATQLSVNRRVAIKVISADTQNVDLVRRFRREAEAMAQLNDPHSVRLFDFGNSDRGEFFIVMEMLEGEDLSDRIEREGALSVALTLELATQILHSLDEAHARGIVHRDLKPANVFLARTHSGKTVVKVLDFGIAAIQRQFAGDTTLTQPGTTLGTPAYMSPEQASAATVDARADLYSLGVIIFEMLTGSLPFSATTPMLMLVEHLRTPPPKLLKARSELAKNPGLQALLDRLLAKEPAARFANTQQVLEAVQQLQSAAPSPVRPRPSTTQFVALAPPRRKMIWLAPVLLLCAVAYGVLTQDNADPLKLAIEPVLEQFEPPASPPVVEASVNEAPAAYAPAERSPRATSRCQGGPWRAPPTPKRTLVSRIFGKSDSDYLRRVELLRVGPACRNIAAAKSAYSAGTIDAVNYQDTIWVLKQKRQFELREAQADFGAHKLSAHQYQARVTSIGREYAGTN